MDENISAQAKIMKDKFFFKGKNNKKLNIKSDSIRRYKCREDKYYKKNIRRRI